MRALHRGASTTAFGVAAHYTFSTCARTKGDKLAVDNVRLLARADIDAHLIASLNPRVARPNIAHPVSAYECRALYNFV